jgi:transcriptional regulator with XRE-family HTH domain
VGDGSVSSGIPALDRLLGGGIATGDNVVWFADRVQDLSPLCNGILDSDPSLTRRVVRLSREAFIPASGAGGDDVDVDVIEAFEPFPSPEQLEELILDQDIGRGDRIVVSSIHDLVTHWGAGTAVEFYTRTCPRLFDRGVIAYWLTERDLTGQSVLEGVERIAQCVFELRGDRLRIRKAEGRPLRVQGTVFGLSAAGEDLDLQEEHIVGRLGEGLRRLRTDRGLSQRQVARLARVTPAAISQTESGRRGLSLDTLVPLCESLGVGLDELLGIGRSPVPRLARHDHLEVDYGGTVPLFDDSDSGVRVHLVDLDSGGSGNPPIAHKGPELVIVATGLILVELGESAPVLRAGDALMVSDVAVQGWSNLADGPSRFFWVAL